MKWENFWAKIFGPMGHPWGHWGPYLRGTWVYDLTSIIFRSYIWDPYDQKIMSVTPGVSHGTKIFGPKIFSFHPLMIIFLGWYEGKKFTKNFGPMGHPWGTWGPYLLNRSLGPKKICISYMTLYLIWRISRIFGWLRLLSPYRCIATVKTCFRVYSIYWWLFWQDK